MNRIKILDFIRGLSCIWVFTFHANGWFENVQGSDNVLANSIFVYGYAGVQVFFVLSGFVIFFSIYSKKSTDNKITEYLKGRYKRIFPTYWLSIVFVLLLTAIAYYFNPDTTLNTSVTYWFSQLTLTQYFFDQPFLVGPYWSLAYELQFYLVCIPFVVMSKKNGIYYFVLLMIISGFARYFFTNQEYLFTNHYLEFAAGGLLYLVYSKIMRLPLGLLLFSALIGCAFVNNYWELKVALLSVIIFYLLIYLERSGFQVPKVSYFLGAITYPLYLIHQPLLFRLDKIVDRIPPGFILNTYFVILLSSLMLAVFFSYCIYRFFEQGIVFRKSSKYSPPS